MLKWPACSHNLYSHLLRCALYCHAEPVLFNYTQTRSDKANKPCRAEVHHFQSSISSSNPQQKSRVRCVIDPDMNYICYILFQGDFHFLVPTSHANDFASRQTRQRFLWKICHILLDVNIAMRGIMIGLIKIDKCLDKHSYNLSGRMLHAHECVYV